MKDHSPSKSPLVPLVAKSSKPHSTNTSLNPHDDCWICLRLFSWACVARLVAVVVDVVPSSSISRRRFRELTPSSLDMMTSGIVNLMARHSFV